MANAGGRGRARGMWRNRLHGAVVAALLMSAAGLAHAQERGTPHDFEIPAGTLIEALDRFGEQSGLQVTYDAALLQGRRAPAVSGQLSADAALARLLRGSGLESDYVNDRSVVIKREAAPAGQPQAAPRSTPATTRSEEAEVQELERLTVTGTRIRGGVTPSPVIAISAQQIQEEGFSDLGEVIRSLPSNFAGGQNPGVTDGARTGASGMANQNLTGGSSLNLRGLGPDATLTLLNGRRLSYGGFVQAVDISAIPIEAVERIEIVADGASAIYGSDAVGGVGNVVLRTHYHGVVIGARYGGATEGGLSTREYTATAGHQWSGGGLIAAYKDASNDPIYARQRHYTEYMFDRANLWPESDLRSGLISVHQSIGNSVELRLDALRTERDQIFYPYNSGLLPFYWMVTTDSKATLISPNIDVMLPNDWTLQLGVVHGQDRLANSQTRVIISTGANDTIVDECFCNKIHSYELGAEGPLFALPGGDARLAVGAGYRRSAFDQENYIVGITSIEGREGSRFAYAEIGLPFVDAASSIPGAQQLVLNLAARSEDYDSFGRVTTPKVGVVYGPNADLTFKASWGRSFKAPTLAQRFWAQGSALDLASYYASGFDSDATLLIFGGGNRNLDAERATTWSASLAIHPEAFPRLDAELTWFDIDYTNRVIEPIPNYGQALTNPTNFGPFISFSPTVQEQEQVISEADTFTNYTGQPYDPANVVAILYAHYVNVARQRVRGVDLSASYWFDVGSGRLTVRGSSSWLDSSQRAIPDAEAFDLSGTLFSPARVNGRLGAVWEQGGFSASGFINYTSGVTNNLVLGVSEKIASFTTFDAVARYQIGQRSDAPYRWELALSAQNLFNREPPFYTPIALSNPPYDSTNYTGVGRFLSISASYRF